MFASNILKTFFSKSFLLIINFGLIVFTTQTWGSEGRGFISLFIADLAIVGIVTDLISGSSLAYHVSRYSLRRLLPLVYTWSVIASAIVALILSFFYTPEYTYHLVLVSVCFGLLNCNVSLFIGSEKLNQYNLLTAVQPIGIALAIVTIYPFKSTPDVYFLAQAATYLLLFALSLTSILKIAGGSQSLPFVKLFGQLINYGWQTQLSSLMQFLNYRLSYFFLAAMQGISSVGIYSIGVALAEAIWTISRSISLVLYSRTINESDDRIRVKNTKLSIKISLYATLVFSAIILLIPADLYSVIFGKNFSSVKSIMIYLLPGIIALATSNVVGHYFSAIYNLKILNIKSFVGLVVTVVTAVTLIPKYGVEGACFSASLSHLSSSAVLMISFYRKHTFRFQELAIRNAELKQIWELMRAGLSKKSLIADAYNNLKK